MYKTIPKIFPNCPVVMPQNIFHAPNVIQICPKGLEDQDVSSD